MSMMKYVIQTCPEVADIHENLEKTGHGPYSWVTVSLMATHSSSGLKSSRLITIIIVRILFKYFANSMCDESRQKDRTSRLL